MCLTSGSLHVPSLPNAIYIRHLDEEARENTIACVLLIKRNGYRNRMDRMNRRTVSEYRRGETVPLQRSFEDPNGDIRAELPTTLWDVHSIKILVNKGHPRTA
ncbi:hypothetical protein ACTXT7_012113 [Hymenolepis weldensis]